MTTARLNPGIPLLLNGVSKRYGSKTILNELDLHIPTGQFVAVVGRSGGGKSSLLRVLTGLMPPAEGEVIVDGENFSGGDAAGHGLIPRSLHLPQEPVC